MSVNVFFINMPDAKKANIKVSVFDAFRTKPRSTKTKKASTRESPKARAEPGAAAKPKAESVATPSTPPTEESNDSKWSEEENKKLLQLKDVAHRTWREITAALGQYSQKEIKTHYRQLKKEQEEKLARTDVEDFVDVMPEHEDGEEDLDVNIDPGSGWDPAIHESVAVFDESEWSEEETTLLEKLNKIYDSNKWIHISSQFYDRTGVRVNPAAVHQKLVQISQAKGH